MLWMSYIVTPSFIEISSQEIFSFNPFLLVLSNWQIPGIPMRNQTIGGSRVYEAPERRGVKIRVAWEFALDIWSLGMVTLELIKHPSFRHAKEHRSTQKVFRDTLTDALVDPVIKPLV